MTNEEAAEALGISVRTAKYSWTHARAWLYREIPAAAPWDRPTSWGGFMRAFLSAIPCAVNISSRDTYFSAISFLTSFTPGTFLAMSSACPFCSPFATKPLSCTFPS